MLGAVRETTTRVEVRWVVNLPANWPLIIALAIASSNTMKMEPRTTLTTVSVALPSSRRPWRVCGPACQDQNCSTSSLVRRHSFAPLVRAF